MKDSSRLASKAITLKQPFLPRSQEQGILPKLPSQIHSTEECEQLKLKPVHRDPRFKK